jgi:cell division protein FtsW
MRLQTSHQRPASPQRGTLPGRVGQDTGLRATSSSAGAEHRRQRPWRGRPHTESRPRGESRTAPVGMRSPLAARFARLNGPGAIDYVLLVAVVGLLLMGLVMVYSASQLAKPGDPSYWFRHQAFWAAVGCAVLVVTARVPYRAWRRWALAGMAVSVVLLLLVLVHGTTIYGGQRWLSLKFLSFQPSELAKLALTLYIAEWLVRKGDKVRSLLYGLVPFALITGVVLLLILAQNDMGTSIVVAVLALVMFYAAGANVLLLTPTLALGGLGMFALAAATSFRRARLDAFLHPLPPGCADAASYQLCQGLIALGSGGIVGRGLGDSVQKAGYLPNPFTDSIFAVTGEELGLLGCLFIVSLFAVLAVRGLRAARYAPDAYGALLACGITCWLVVQAAVNVGSVVDAIPFTGVPLPFVSFGGSSLVTSLAAVGILLNITRHCHQPAAPTLREPR